MTFGTPTENTLGDSLGSIVRKNNFPYFNSSPGMMRINSSLPGSESLDFSDLYTGQDGYHLNAYGNKVCAFLVADFISSKIEI
ncbi:hypothetical protein KKD03_04065 [Patescibacteria group bacterium]|nr:hypothetical protein [Patescibacteria group bacterium]